MYYIRTDIKSNSAVAQMVRVVACHAIGRRFESRQHCKLPLGTKVGLMARSAKPLIREFESHPRVNNIYGLVVQLVRTLHCHCRGRGFESHTSCNI